MHHKHVLSILWVCVFLLLRIDLLQSQCNPDPLPTPICDSAPLSCMAGQCYETGTPTPDVHNGWCGPNTAIHNAQYFMLIASSTMTTVMITVNSCEAGGCGLQCALIDTCDWENTNVLDCDPGTNVGGTMVLEYQGLEVGKAYWIVIDGCGGQICEYTFVSVEGFAQGPVTEIEMPACNGVVVFEGIEYAPGVYEIVYENPAPEVCDSIVQLTVSAQTSVELDIAAFCDLETDTIEVGPTVVGIGGPYTFEWHDGDTDSLRVFTDLSQGDSISVTVTDSEGCTGTAITAIAGIIESVEVFPAQGYFCPGGVFNDPLNFIVTGGVTPYLFEWILPGDTLPIPLPMVLDIPGTHIVLVTDVNGCQATGQFELIEEAPPVAMIMPVQPVFCDGSFVTISASPSVGIPPFSYIWQTSSGTSNEESIDVSEVDSITLSVTDATGCTSTVDFEVTEHPRPEVEIVSPGLLCADDLAAGVPISVTLGPDVIGYQLSPNWSATPFIVSSTGMHYITVTNASCVSIDSVFISATEPLVPTIRTRICDNHVSFTAFPDGGTYLWDFGDGTTDTMRTTAHLYEGSGPFIVRLTVFGECDTASVTMELNLDSPQIPQNTLCQFAHDFGVIASRSAQCHTGDAFNCTSGFNTHAPSMQLESSCAGMFNPTVWYVLQTDDEALLLNISIKSQEFPSAAIQLFESADGTCADLNPVMLTGNALPCVLGSGGELLASGTPVLPLTTYYLAVSGINTIGGQFDLCLNVVAGTPVCVTDASIEIVGRSIGGSPEEPFFPGEQVEICMTVHNFQVSTGVQNCQWFQGLVPVFGSGWDPASFDSAGMPLNARLNDNAFPDVPNVENAGIWNWWSDVHYHHPHCNLNTGQFDADATLDLCHNLIDTDCQGQGFEGGCCGPCWMENPGDLLPPGWFTAGVNGSCGAFDGHPSVDWGDGNTCSGATGPWSFCFDLQVRNDIDPLAHDLSLGFFTFSDGETGSWTGGVSVCGEDMPVISQLPFCAGEVVILEDTLEQICSGTEIFVELDFSEIDIWHWQLDTSNATATTTSGVLTCGEDLIHTPINTLQEEGYATYQITGFSGVCPVVLRHVIVPLQPGINVAFTPGLSVCAVLDSFLVTAIVESASDSLEYLWGNGSQESFIYVLNPQPGDLITVTVTDLVSGCSTTLSGELNDDGPEIEVTPLSAVLCPGDDGIDFTFEVLSGTPPYLLQWTTPSNPIPGEQPIFNEIGTYRVIATDSLLCTSVTEFTVEEGFAPEAAFQVVIVGDSVYFINLSSHALTAEWDLGDGTTSEEWSPNHQYAVSGEYSVTLTVTGECGTSAITQVIQVTGVSAKDVSEVSDVLIVPNPNDGSFSILTDDCEIKNVVAYDWLGRVAALSQGQNSSFGLVQRLPGIYTLVIECREVKKVRRMVVQ